METDPAPHPSSRPAPPVRRRHTGLIASSLLASLVVGGAVGIALGGGDGSIDDEATRLSPDDTALSLGDSGLVAPGTTGNPVPEGTFESFSGDEIAFADFGGAPLVVNFFATFCAPCIRELPAVQEVAAELEGQVTFLGVNPTEPDPAGAAALAERSGITFELLRDPTGRALAGFGGIGLPTTAFVDEDGRIRGVSVGELDADELRALVEEHLGVRP